MTRPVVAEDGYPPSLTHTREQVYRAESEGVGRLVGVHEPECICLNRTDDLAGQCDCRIIRMLVIEILREQRGELVGALSAAPTTEETRP